MLTSLTQCVVSVGALWCVQVAYNVADNVPKLVICDAQRLQQVLLNVLNNAVKFTEKGEILLEVWCEPQEEGLSAQQDAAECQQDVSEDASDSQDRAEGSQALLGHVSKDSCQQVEVTGPSLEAFRPLTPDNLSQHTELAEMRQQVQGPAPSFAQHAAGGVDALAASFNICRHGVNCSCPGVEGGSIECKSESPHATVQQQTTDTEQAQHTNAASRAASEDEEEQLEPQQQDTEHQLHPSDTFTSAAPSDTSEGQQHIVATSRASADASTEGSPADASASYAADRLGAASSGIAAEPTTKRSNESRRRQAMDGCQERMHARKQNSHASTSGRHPEDASHYTLNFSVRDSGIGISGENLHNLFQCFCQVRSRSVYTTANPCLPCAFFCMLQALTNWPLQVRIAVFQSVMWRPCGSDTALACCVNNHACKSHTIGHVT